MAESYVGLETQIRRNNLRSTILLIAFPGVILAGVYAVLYFTFGGYETTNINEMFMQVAPLVGAGVGIWFLIAFFMHSSMITSATKSTSLERKSNMRVYNLVENLCMAEGMIMPKLNML